MVKRTASFVSDAPDAPRRSAAPSSSPIPSAFDVSADLNGINVQTDTPALYAGSVPINRAISSNEPAGLRR